MAPDVDVPPAGVNGVRFEVDVFPSDADFFRMSSFSVRPQAVLAMKYRHIPAAIL